MNFGSAIGGQSVQSSSNNVNQQYRDQKFIQNAQHDVDRPRSAQMNVGNQQFQRGVHKTRTARMDNQAYSGDFQQEGGIMSQ